MEMAGSQSCRGSAFHEDGPDEQNARGPSVEVDVRGMNSLCWSAELSSQLHNVHLPISAKSAFSIPAFTVSFQCFDTVGWLQETHPAGKKLGAGLLMVTIWLELCTSCSSSCHHSPPPSSLAPIKSGMETFWYRLTPVYSTWKMALKTDRILHLQHLWLLPVFELVPPPGGYGFSSASSDICQQDYAKSTEPVFTKRGRKMVHERRKKSSDFGGNLDHVTSELGLWFGGGRNMSRNAGCVVPSSCFIVTVLQGDRKGIRPVKETGCWFVGGDDLTGALHDL